MGLRSRILKVVHPESGGDRSRNVLSGLARPGENFERIFNAMLRRRELVPRGTKRGTRYGLPRTTTQKG